MDLKTLFLVGNLKFLFWNYYYFLVHYQALGYPSKSKTNIFGSNVKNLPSKFGVQE